MLCPSPSVHSPLTFPSRRALDVWAHLGPVATDPIRFISGRCAGKAPDLDVPFWSGPTVSLFWRPRGLKQRFGLRRFLRLCGLWAVALLTRRWKSW